MLTPAPLQWKRLQPGWYEATGRDGRRWRIVQATSHRWVVIRDGRELFDFPETLGDAKWFAEEEDDPEARERRERRRARRLQLVQGNAPRWRCVVCEDRGCEFCPDPERVTHALAVAPGDPSDVETDARRSSSPRTDGHGGAVEAEEPSPGCGGGTS